MVIARKSNLSVGWWPSRTTAFRQLFVFESINYLAEAATNRAAVSFCRENFIVQRERGCFVAILLEILTILVLFGRVKDFGFSCFGIVDICGDYDYRHFQV